MWAIFILTGLLYFIQNMITHNVDFIKYDLRFMPLTIFVWILIYPYEENECETI